jgi:predicted alpha-1,2-mannosidase
MVANLPRCLAPAFLGVLGLGVAGCSGAGGPPPVAEPSAYVDPFIGSANGGNTFPGAVTPFGMVAWSPETTRGDATRRPAAGGYQYDATRARGFSLTHLSGTGCRGASGDVPFLPWTRDVRLSPSADTADRVFALPFDHANESAQPGYYQVRLRDGVNVELTATARTGAGRFTFPPDGSQAMLVRTSDSEIGSSAARASVDVESRTISGSVSSGDFCGYIGPLNPRSYYTLYFVARFDRPFAATGGWRDGRLDPGGTEASGGTTWDEHGNTVKGKGSGVWVTFDSAGGTVVNVRVGISYVSLDGARANLAAESPETATFDDLRAKARASWEAVLRQIQISGGTDAQRTIFYTALYHALLHPNLFSDADGRYAGFDGAVHSVEGAQKAQYANFSGWDVYRGQLQLVTLLDPRRGADIAQSLYNQAKQNGGDWDRWTHNTGATHVMEGDAAAPAVAGIYAFGDTDFDAKGALTSLLRAARVPTAADSSNVGCPVLCPGQRPSLDDWLTLHYIPARSNAWGGAGETLEDASADFALSQLAASLGEPAAHDEMLARSGYWRNLYNPHATPAAGYIQDRDADGTWTDLDPASSRGFAEGSSAQYTWMVPFDPAGLFEMMGGDSVAVARLDAYFHTADGGWALTGLGGLHSEMDNEPSVGTPWLYLFAGRPDRTGATVRRVLETLWSPNPYGIPGNDDLGAMSAWYVWSSMGMYPLVPGRSELMLTAPLFARVVVRRADGTTITVEAPDASADAMYVSGLEIDGATSTRSWLPASFVGKGGTLRFDVSPTPSPRWGRDAADAPPSFGPSGR